MTTATGRVVQSSTTTRSTVSSLNMLARIAGVLYMVIIIAGMFADGFARPSLIVDSDATPVTFPPQRNVQRMVSGFRMSIVADLAMIMSDVAIGLVFYLLLRSVNYGLSLLTAFFRLAQAATLGINLLVLFIALQFLSGADYLTAVFTADQLDAIALVFLGAHGIGYKLALVFFAFSILIQGYLLYKSGYVPKILAILVVIASFGYFIDNFATFIMPNYDAYAEIFEMIVIVSALTGETALGLWLLVRGISTTEDNNIQPGATLRQAGA